MHQPSNAAVFTINALLIALAAIALSGCEVIGDIFQAGFWTGVVIVAIVAAIAFLAFRAFR